MVSSYVSPHFCLCSFLSAPIARPAWISVTSVLLTFPVYKAHVFPLLSLPAGSAIQCAFVPVIPVCFVGPQISGQWLFWFKLMALFVSLWIFFTRADILPRFDPAVSATAVLFGSWKIRLNWTRSPAQPSLWVQTSASGVADTHCHRITARRWKWKAIFLI